MNDHSRYLPSEFFWLIDVTLSLAPGLPVVRAIASPPLSSEERYQRAFAMIRELRGYLELPDRGRSP